MKRPLTVLFLLITFLVFGQETHKPYPEFSYTEFFEMIKAEQDTAFKLENASIKYTPEKDSATYGKPRHNR